MKKFNPLPDTDSDVMYDAHNPNQFYAIQKAEWDRALQRHLELGHPESHDNRYFAGLPDDFMVRVRPYLANEDESEYYEQDQFVDFPANRIVPIFVRIV